MRRDDSQHPSNRLYNGEVSGLAEALELYIAQFAYERGLSDELDYLMDESVTMAEKLQSELIEAETEVLKGWLDSANDDEVNFARALLNQEYEDLAI